MAELLRGKMDRRLRKIAEALGEYERTSVGAKASYYRRNNVSVRIRIIDPAFSDLSKAERGEKVWPLLRKLPEDVRADITILLLLAPEEVKGSFANADFEDPVPSRV